MRVEEFIKGLGAEFFVGVPDSRLKPVCNYIMDTYGLDKAHHIIAANEGNAVAIAAGYYLATQNIPVVYMQNSGEGNIINPVASLLNEKIYAIPMIFIIGYRGEPGERDEPQHVFQGEITLKLLDILGIEYMVLDKNVSGTDLENTLKKFKNVLCQGKCAAFVVKKGGLSYKNPVKYENSHVIKREEAIEMIVKSAGNSPVVSTTGKASRELFELRERLGLSHKYDFLTVGSMGHCSSIALGIAVNKPDIKIWCIDGDAASIMHMGAMGIIGASGVNNLVHIVINNESHETVGGMPSAAKVIDLADIAGACGYKNVVSVDNLKNLDVALKNASGSKALSFIEVKVKIGSRADLGRPTTAPIENKEAFMQYLKEECSGNSC